MHPDAPLFFDRAPHLLPLYIAFETALCTRFPSVSVRVQKTQISFDAPGLFACVSAERRKTGPGLIVTFGLAYRLESGRIAQAVSPSPGRWTHHVLIREEAEIDRELMDWLNEAYAFSCSRRHRARTP